MRRMLIKDCHFGVACLGSKLVASREKAVISVHRREYSSAYDCKAHFLRLYDNLGKTTWRVRFNVKFYVQFVAPRLLCTMPLYLHQLPATDAYPE